jgi:hypothetical protein
MNSKGIVMNIVEDVKLLPLPSNLKDWTQINLIKSFKLTNRADLREMIAIELNKRIEQTT